MCHEHRGPASPHYSGISSICIASEGRIAVSLKYELPCSIETKFSRACPRSSQEPAVFQLGSVRDVRVRAERVGRRQDMPRAVAWVMVQVLPYAVETNRR